MASVVVELVARNPVRVVRNTFSILTFDAEGRIDPSKFDKQQFALAESVVAPVLPYSMMAETEQSSTRPPDSLHKEANGFHHALWRAS